MSRIRNAALLAAAMAVSTLAQAAPQSARQRSDVEDALATRRPPAHRHVDKDDQMHAQGLDYTQEGRLNEKAREELRKKRREEKARVRTTSE